MGINVHLTELLSIQTRFANELNFSMKIRETNFGEVFPSCGFFSASADAEASAILFDAG
jgi:hypothetical protein